MRRRDGHLQPFILPSAGGQWPLQPSIKATAGEVQHPRHDRHRVIPSPLLHKRVPGSHSLAKYAVAFFKISRSNRASASSLRNCFTSASNSATERAPGAALAGDALALDTQLRSVAFGSDNRVAAVPSDSPWCNTSLTASARNSGV